MQRSKKLRPKTKSITGVDIHLNNTGELRFLIISDLHIGQFESTAKSTPPTFEKVREAVEITHPTHIFILGDIVHFKPYHICASWTDFYMMLETLNIPIHIIPGNHERYMHSLVKAVYNEHNVRLHNKEIIRLFVNGYKYPVILGHDLKNDMRVHGEEITRELMDMLRRTFQILIPDESLLVLGHVHDHVESLDKLSYTVMPFSHELSCYEYAVITPGETDKFNIEFGALPGSINPYKKD